MPVGAPRNALRAFNAGVSLCILRCRRSQSANLLYGVGVGRSASLYKRKASRRTRRMARRKRNVSDLPYTAPHRFASLSLSRSEQAAKRKVERG